MKDELKAGRYLLSFILHPSAFRFALRARIESFDDGFVSWLGRVVLVEEESRSLLAFRPVRNPTVFIREAPRLKSRASRLLKAGGCQKAVDVRLLREFRLIQDATRFINGQRNIHLRKMYLQPQSREPRQVRRRG